jgi:hypothetical protein
MLGMMTKKKFILAFLAAAFLGPMIHVMSPRIENVYEKPKGNPCQDKYCHPDVRLFLSSLV